MVAGEVVRLTRRGYPVGSSSDYRTRDCPLFDGKEEVEGSAKSRSPLSGAGRAQVATAAAVREEIVMPKKPAVNSGRHPGGG